MIGKKIYSSTAVLMVVIVISKLVGMARDVVLANYFGTSAASDAYLIAVSVPTLLFYFIGHSLSTAYLPMFNKIRNNEGSEAAGQYSNNLICISLVISTVLVVLLLIFPETVIKVFAAGFDPETTALSAQFVRLSAISLYFMVIVNIWGGYLHTNKNYIVPAAISIPRNVVIILSIVLAAYVHIVFLGIGLLIAYVSEFVFLLPSVKRNGYKFQLSFQVSDKRIQETLYLVLPILLGVGVSQINKIIDKSIASTIAEGGISALSYAAILNNAVQEVVVTGIITILFANCAALVAEGKHQLVKARLGKTLDTITFFLVPASVGIIVLAEPIVTVFLQRGSFDQNSMLMTASALRYYTCGLVFLAVRDALVKVFYAYKNTKIVTASSIAAIGINIALNLLLSQILGLSGLALATSLSAVFQCGVLCVLFSKKHGGVEKRKLVLGAVKSIGSSLIMAVTVYNVHTRNLPNDIALVPRLCISIAAGVVVYIGVNLIFDRKRVEDQLRLIIE